MKRLSAVSLGGGSTEEYISFLVLLSALSKSSMSQKHFYNGRKKNLYKKLV